MKKERVTKKHAGILYGIGVEWGDPETYDLTGTRNDSKL